MEVIPSTARGSGSVPLHQHNVEEWSRLDSLTGMLEHARVETGHWAANTSTSSQKYGKVVDSRARNLADGSMQQRQRKQLEVFQAQVPGGSLQVIRTQSMTSTSSSSSSWRSTLHSNANVASDFENIQSSVKPLDLSTQKTKASVGRSGSHGRRRPPSRPCSIISKVDTDICERNLPPNAEKEDVDQRLSEVSRICRKIHEESKNNTSNSLLFPLSQSSFSSPVLSDNTMIKPDNINRRDFIDINHSCTKLDKQNSLSILDTLSDSAKKTEETVSNRSGHAIITRNKSCSVEDIQNNNHGERDRLSEGTEMSTDLARTAGIRRSLQLPNRGNNIYFPNGNVSKFCQEFQDGKALDVIKNNATGFEALENIFRYDSGSERNTSLLFGKNNQAPKFNLVTDNSGNGYELLKSGIFDPIKVSSCKRHSFVTVESLKEVRGRLRHLGTPSLDGFQRADNTKCQTRHVEDSDDGIVVEDFSKSVPGINPGLAEQVSSSHVKSYVYGMEAMANCQSDINKSAGTGSLESRTCNRSSSSGGSRSEEWYSRRKSYGFEQVHKPQADNHSEPVTFQEKTSVESSTDSGICRSSETVTTPSWAPFDREKKANGLSTYGNLNVNSSIKEKQHSNNGIMTQTENRGTEISSQSGGRTVVTFGSDNKGNKQDLYSGGNIMENSSIIVQNGWVSGCDSRTTNIMMSNTNAKNFRRFSEPVTVTIPIVHDDSFNNINGNGIMDAKKLHLKQFSEGSSLSIENEWSSGTSLRSRNDSSQKGLANVSKTFAARRQLFQKHSGGNVWSPASKQSDNQVKRHSIAVDESKYVREDLKNYNLYDKRMEHINFENVFRTNSTCIPHLENSTGLSLSNNKYVVPLQKELEFRIPTATRMSQDASDCQSASFTFENGDDDDELFLQNQLAGKKHKKVEFCKTEVHFAAEPGRFNIVETDEKPPPNSIRRRRRSSCVVSSAPQAQDGKTSLPETRFGDSPYEMKLLGGTESNNTPCQIDVSADGCNKSDLNNPARIMPASSFPSEFQDDADNIFVQGNATVLSSGRQDTMEIEVHSNEKDVCNDSIILQPNPMISTSPKPRSILKNSKSPRLFHLGETDEDILISGINGKSETLNGSPETKWGVRLKPIHNQDLTLSTTSTWKSRVTLTNPKLDDQKQQNYSPSSTLKDGKLQFLHSSVEGTEFRKQPKSFQLPFQKMSADVSVTPMLSNTQSPESGGNGMEVKIFSAPTWSVAERVRQVEDMKRASLEASGYSTKVNLVSGKTTVMDSRSSDEQQKQPIPLLPRYQQNSHQKSVCLHIDKHKEEAMHRCDPADGSSMLKQEFTSQKPVKKDNSQSHNSDLHPKETLISSRSVQPKITSISLQYEEEKSTEQPPHVCDTNSDCDRYQTSFHSLLSPKKENLQMNELECPTDFEVNASSTTVSSTPCNKPLFTLQNCNTNSSKSLFTQKHKSLLTSVVASHIEPETHTLHFTHDEINYKNLNPRTQKRSTNDNFGTDHTISPLGKKVLHPEIEDKFALYHNHNKHDYFSKCSSKQESDPMVLSNSMSLHSVLNKTTSKDQHKKQFHASFSKQYTPSVTSISSDLISNRSNTSESTNKERIKVKEEETKKDGHFKVKTSDEKHKHLDRTFKHESEEETKISDHYHERDSMTSRVNSTNYLSTKYDSSGGKIHSGREVVMSPVYENMKMSDVEPITKSSSQNFTNAGETESDILEELTQAADQILQAVVGYTDEESCRASSDDPDDEIVQCSRRRRGSRCGKVQKPLVSLGTITEAPLSKKQQETRNRTSDLRSHKSIGSARKSQQIKKTHHQPTSSTSSLESFTREISQVQKRALLKQEGSGSVDNYSKRKVASSSTSSMPIKSGSRTTRLFQRANSREHLLQTYTSSSEDVASGVKGDNNRKPLVPRCTRSHNSFNNRSDPVKSDLRKSTVSPDTQPTLSAKVRARKRDPESTKPKERLPGPSNRMLPLVRKSDGCVSGKPSGGKLHTFRSREDRHQRSSSRLTVKRENTDLVHRVQGGGMTTLEPGIHDTSKRTVIHERRVMGSAGGFGPSSASCVVPHVYPISASSVNHHDNSRTKKNLGLASSQNKELIQRKATK